MLIGSGPFEERYVSQIMQRRLARLSSQETEQFLELLAVLNQCEDSKKEDTMNRLAALVEKSDNFDPLAIETDAVDLLPVNGKMYASVWPQAAELRRDGRLVVALKKLACPVHVLHGDSDPHPVEGVIEPLRENRVDFTCHVLKDCGHSPFRERKAHREFYRILMKILHDNKIDQVQLQ